MATGNNEDHTQRDVAIAGVLGATAGAIIGYLLCRCRPAPLTVPSGICLPTGPKEIAISAAAPTVGIDEDVVITGFSTGWTDGSTWQLHVVDAYDPGGYYIEQSSPPTGCEWSASYRGLKAGTATIYGTNEDDTIMSNVITIEVT